jgi:GH15 family glucan-1,4-alpha-glucosidase
MPEDPGLTRRSIEVICGLQEEDGGILATFQDDAYPFVYPRDASFMTMALNMHGLSDRSKKFYNFLLQVRRPGGEIYHRYNKGHPYVTQQGEADVTPIVIQGIYDTYMSSRDADFLESMWSLINEGVGFVIASIDGAAGLVYTTRSIHETQFLEEGFEIWANTAAVKGLLDASRMAELLRHRDSAEAWLAKAKALWREINEKLYERENGLFIKNLRKDGTRVNAPDVAQLSPFYFGLCDDERILETTLGHLRQNLWNEAVGGVNRFRDFDVVKDWHWYTGGTGASWPLFTLWMAELYGRLGETHLKDECLRFVRSASTKDMEIPEKVAPRSGFSEWMNNETAYNERILRGIARAENLTILIPEYIPWACPLGWSHAEYLMLGRDDNTAEECRFLRDGRASV